MLGLFRLWPLFNGIDHLQATLEIRSCDTYCCLKAYMHLGRCNLSHAHKAPWRQQRDLKKRFRGGCVLDVAWLRFSKEVICHPMPQQPRQLLYRNPGLVRELLKGCP